MARNCIPGKRCNCPREYDTCMTWTALFDGTTKPDYQNLALESGDPMLDRLGWDMVCEEVAECANVDNLRSVWMAYQTCMYDALKNRDAIKAQFWAWAMVYVEKVARGR